MKARKDRPKGGQLLIFPSFAEWADAVSHKGFDDAEELGAVERQKYDAAMKKKAKEEGA